MTKSISSVTFLGHRNIAPRFDYAYQRGGKCDKPDKNDKSCGKDRDVFGHRSEKNDKGSSNEGSCTKKENNCGGSGKEKAPGSWDKN